MSVGLLVGLLLGLLLGLLVRNAQAILAYKPYADEIILIILTHMTDIDDTFKLTRCQGHKVKGQGHLSIYVKSLFQQ